MQMHTRLSNSNSMTLYKRVFYSLAGALININLMLIKGWCGNQFSQFIQSVGIKKLTRIVRMSI